MRIKIQIPRFPILLRQLIIFWSAANGKCDGPPAALSSFWNSRMMMMRTFACGDFPTKIPKRRPLVIRAPKEAGIMSRMHVLWTIPRKRLRVCSNALATMSSKRVLLRSPVTVTARKAISGYGRKWTHARAVFLLPTVSANERPFTSPSHASTGQHRTVKSARAKRISIRRALRVTPSSGKEKEIQGPILA